MYGSAALVGSATDPHRTPKGGAMARPIIPAVDRFMSHVSPEPNSGCWLWAASTNSAGYGSFRVGSKARRTSKKVLAHRFSFDLLVGPIPQGMFVCHKCDVRSCVNPEHLYLGNEQINLSDMALKCRGRQSLAGLPYGVTRSRNSSTKNPFTAQVHFLGENIQLGAYATAEEAGAVASAERDRLHGTILDAAEGREP